MCSFVHQVVPFLTVFIEQILGINSKQQREKSWKSGNLNPDSCCVEMVKVSVHGIMALRVSQVSK